MHCSSPFPLYSYVNPLLHLVLKNNIITSLKVRQRLLVGVMNYLFTIRSAALASLTALLACPSACWQGKRISYILLSSSSVSSATSFFSTTPPFKIFSPPMTASVLFASSYIIHPHHPVFNPHSFTSSGLICPLS